MYVGICLERVSLRGILSPGNLFLELAIVKPCWRNCSPLHLLDGINRTSGSHENEHNYYHFGGQRDLVKRWKQGSKYNYTTMTYPKKKRKRGRLFIFWHHKNKFEVFPFLHVLIHTKASCKFNLFFFQYYHMGHQNKYLSYKKTNKGQAILS